MQLCQHTASACGAALFSSAALTHDFPSPLSSTFPTSEAQHRGCAKPHFAGLPLLGGSPFPGTGVMAAHFPVLHFVAAVILCPGEVHKLQKASPHAEGSRWLQLLPKQTCSPPYVCTYCSEPLRGIQQRQTPHKPFSKTRELSALLLTLVLIISGTG